mmetsp:Transcript_19027/g.26619  ORF Transcript_19027/g.26619 Transcript_19027/m.26619 type:complete len:159 (-) Transcript_19027:55-531(-)
MADDLNQQTTTTQVVENLRNPKDVTQELKRLVEKKANIEQKLISLEKQIYALEGSYLHDTRNLGNILTGWENYLSSRSGALKRPMKFKESDRLFSLSSVTALKSNGFGSEKYDNSTEMKSESSTPPSDYYEGNGEPKQKYKKQPGRPRKFKNEDEEWG